MATTIAHEQISAILELEIETLALSEAELIAHVGELMADADAYRAIAQTAFHAVHDLTRQRDRLRERFGALVNEYRALRASQRRAA